MHALIVYAHPERTSFTAAMKDAAEATLTALGHSVDVSDLYAERFDPVAGRHDFQSAADPARFHYQTEQLHAAATQGFADDILREQTRVARADLMLFVFPLWWGGLPAILKGWFDRVMAYGFAYADGKRFDAGYFRGRRALMGACTGGTRDRFSDEGAYGDIERVLYPVRHCMIEYLGLEVLDPFMAYGVPRVDAEVRDQYLHAWSARVAAAIEDPAWQSVARATGTAFAQRLAQGRAEGAGWNRRP
jgi:NAD(P)H dehydrogenase (quinone)